MANKESDRPVKGVLILSITFQKRFCCSKTFSLKMSISTLEQSSELDGVIQ